MRQAENQRHTCCQAAGKSPDAMRSGKEWRSLTFYFLQHDDPAKSYAIIALYAPAGRGRDMAKTQVRMKSQILREEREVPQQRKFPMEVIRNDRNSSRLERALRFAQERGRIRSDREHEEENRGIE